MASKIFSFGGSKSPVQINGQKLSKQILGICRLLAFKQHEFREKARG
jgi:hypothetical protein